MLKGCYVITGATGLMGTSALMRLKDVPGVSVRAIWHKRDPFVLADNIRYLKADLTDAGETLAAFKGGDYLLNFAGVLMTAPVLAVNPVRPLTTNLILNLRMLEGAYAAGIKKVIFIGSSTGYPPRDTALGEEEMFREDPSPPYFALGWMFRYAETLCRLYATKLKEPLSVAVLRPSTIYGEYEDFDPATSHMLPALIAKVASRQDPVQVWGSPELKRDLVHADDVLEACLLALAAPVPYQVYNVAHGTEYSVTELLRMIMDEDGWPQGRAEFVSDRPVTGGRRVLDTTLIRRELGFHPRVDMATGIRRMLRFYKSAAADKGTCT